MPLKMTTTAVMVLAITFLHLNGIWCQRLEDDFRFVSFEDLMKFGGERFADENVTSFYQILPDVARDQIFVGARDNIYRISTRGLRILEKAPWTASSKDENSCIAKGQSEDNCHNYIKVLLTDGSKLFACGTNAFSPKCSWRELESINSVVEWVNGEAKCPYSPNANIAALMTMTTGQYYVGTQTDFAGSIATIYRALGSEDDGDSTLRTKQYDSIWLNEPQFVSSFEDDKFVYFVFREAAVEYINCGKTIYSRIARVCKNDNGGGLVTPKTWTTFIKARLNCSLPGEYPFYYDEVQGVEYLPNERLLYATFTTPKNSIAGSAICVYNMTAIDHAFNGPFKHQENVGSAWESRHNHNHNQLHNQCQRSSTRSNHMQDSSPYQLMDQAIQPATMKPLHTVNLERYSLLTTATISTKHTNAHILFVATDAGYIKKLAVYPYSDSACLIEIWKLELNTAMMPVKTINYLKETNSVYIGSETSVLRIPAARCEKHLTQNSCLGAQDPLCGWEIGRETCIGITGSASYGSWTQDEPACPNISMPVDGGWSSWSKWDVCVQKNEDLYYEMRNEDSQDKCLCQTRECNNPIPKNDGNTCDGPAIRVTNCTVHGGWTTWSSWSACSATCGLAAKWRRRTCGAPAPQHGGRLCVGQDREEIYCTGNPPCPTPVEPIQEGSWSEWSQWSSCSAQCGGGARWRSRRCDSPPPGEGAPPCSGCAIEAEPCNSKPCEKPKYQRQAVYTSWLPVMSKEHSNGGYVEKRFKCTCGAHTADSIKISTKDEKRYCDAEGKCGSVPELNGWSDWSEWDACSVDCGGGYQTSTRACEKTLCEGNAKRQRVCNIHSCSDKDIWTEWYPCDYNGKQYRCKKIPNEDNEDYCQGSNIEVRSCDYNELNNEILPAHRPEAVQVAGHGGGDPQSGSVVITVLVVMLVLLLVLFAVVVIVFFKLRHKQRKNRIPSSPHYITQPNSYVSVPLKEVPKKRKPSFSGNQSTSGTMTLSKSNNINADKNNSLMGTPKLYPKSMAAEYEPATLKRNSHTLQSNGNCRNNLDLEQEKFY